MGQMFLDGMQIQLNKIDKIGDPLVEINKVIKWEMFRKPLENAIRKANYDKGGRPPWDVILMFKIVMLISWYGLSYERSQYQINDRLSFMRFLGVELGGKLPSDSAIWDFKEAIKNTGVEEKLFKLFNKHLGEIGYELKSGSMVDASFVEVPKRRVITETELKEPEKMPDNELIQVTLEEGEKDGKPVTWVIPEDEKTEHILSQTDFNARWTKKNNQSFFGYKDHAEVDVATKFIIGFDVTSAEVHDSRIFTKFINSTTVAVYADSAYMSEDIIAALKKINPDIKINICHRAYKNKPLTDEQKAENSLISKVRARVEHVFGFMTRSMGGMVLNCIGIERARRDIGLKNLGYNMQRLVTLKRV
jgi:IS5 family transposase